MQGHSYRSFSSTSSPEINDSPRQRHCGRNLIFPDKLPLFSAGAGDLLHSFQQLTIRGEGIGLYRPDDLSITGTAVMRAPDLTAAHRVAGNMDGGREQYLKHTPEVWRPVCATPPEAFGQGMPLDCTGVHGDHIADPGDLPDGAKHVLDGFSLG